MNEQEAADDLDAALKAKDWDRVLNHTLQLLMDVTMVQLKHEKPELKELTYIKAPIYTDKGVYLLTIMHVDGEKLQIWRTGEQTNG